MKSPKWIWHVIGGKVEVVASAFDSPETNTELSVSNNLEAWNRLAILMAIQADKPPSRRDEIKVFQEALPETEGSFRMSNSDWNDLALSSLESEMR